MAYRKRQRRNTDNKNCYFVGYYFTYQRGTEKRGPREPKMMPDKLSAHMSIYGRDTKKLFKVAADCRQGAVLQLCGRHNPMT
jgi:hypothetical protein